MSKHAAAIKELLTIPGFWMAVVIALLPLLPIVLGLHEEAQAKTVESKRTPNKETEMIGFESIISKCEEKVGRKFGPVSDGWHVSGDFFLKVCLDRLILVEEHPNGEEAQITSIGMAAPKALAESFANDLALFVQDAD